MGSRNGSNTSSYIVHFNYSKRRPCSTERVGLWRDSDALNARQVRPLLLLLLKDRDAPFAVLFPKLKKDAASILAHDTGFFERCYRLKKRHITRLLFKKKIHSSCNSADQKQHISASFGKLRTFLSSKCTGKAARFRTFKSRN